MLLPEIVHIKIYSTLYIENTNRHRLREGRVHEKLFQGTPISYTTKRKKKLLFTMFTSPRIVYIYINTILHIYLLKHNIFYRIFRDTVL